VELILSSDLPPARAWDAAFREGRYASPVLAEAIYILHKQGKHDIAVEGLLSSLRNDHSQPWTYDILASEMALAERPRSEIERVLVSRVDFTNTSVPQMMITAAMLSRMEARGPAVKLCRQATENAPFMPETWLLGRRIADNSDDEDAQAWFRCGILRHLHSPEHSADRREAVQSIRKLIDSAESAGKASLASQLREQLQSARATDLRIRLRWVGPADLDLLVEEPNGDRCDLRQRVTRSGGQLVREDGGIGQRTNGQRIEEYVCQTAPSGTYTAVVRFVFGNVVTGKAVLEVVQHENTPQESRSTVTVPLSREDARIRVDLANGRAE
jgi:hypothetical protein